MKHWLAKAFDSEERPKASHVLSVEPTISPVDG